MCLPTPCYNKHECYFGKCPSYRVFSFPKFDLFQPSGVGEKVSAQLGPVKTSSLNHWTRPGVRKHHVLQTRHGIWIGNWIYWNLITTNYSKSLIDLHALQITTALQYVIVITGRCLAVDPNNFPFCSCRCRHFTISQLSCCSKCWITTK
jgi:hypothetical protein